MLNDSGNFAKGKPPHIHCSSTRFANKNVTKDEATVGFEPTNKGFANLCLATWLRRLKELILY